MNTRTDVSHKMLARKMALLKSAFFRPDFSGCHPTGGKGGGMMVRQAHGRWKGLALWLCLALMSWAVPAEAQQIGNWSGYFPNGGEIMYFDHPMTVGQDGSVTLVTTVDSTFLDQFSSISVLDQNGDTIDFTILTTSPKTWAVPLAAGSFVVRIARGLTNRYGNYTITANLAPASPGATETENNDEIADANTNPDNLFAGAIGYIRAKNVKDLSDYYRFTLAADGSVRFYVNTGDTLLSFNTVLSLRNASDAQINYTYLSDTFKAWDLYLAPGTYYLRVFTHDFSRYGGYSITTTTTPAVASPSETEINDSIAAANPIESKTLYGSIGYMRETGAYDDYDYFSCQVSQGGSLSAQILSPATLVNSNNTISIRDASNTQLNYAYLSGSPRTVTVNNLAAGTYYILVYRAVGYGAYQINVSGNVILPSPGSVGSIISPLLLSE
jgi:hypothetical protein